MQRLPVEVYWEVRKCEEALEAMLIASKFDIDLITIHGKMEKHD